MKKVFLAMAMVLMFAGTAFAASNVSFSWDANTESDLAGYKLYQGTTPGVYDGVVADIPAGTETVTISNIPDGTYHWAVTAYDNDNNESGYSNEVTKRVDTTPPDNPNGLLISAIEKVIAGLQDIKTYLVAQAK